MKKNSVEPILTHDHNKKITLSFLCVKKWDKSGGKMCPINTGLILLVTNYITEANTLLCLQI